MIDRFPISLTEQNDAISLGIEELAVHVADASAGAAMDHNDGIALGVAAEEEHRQTRRESEHTKNDGRQVGLRNRRPFLCAACVYSNPASS